MDEVLAALKRVGGGALTATISGAGTGEYRVAVRLGQRPAGRRRTASSSGANPAFLSPTTTSDPGSIPSPLAVPSDSPAAGAPLMSQPPGKSGSKGTLVAAVVGALAIAGIVGFVALRPEQAGDGDRPHDDDRHDDGDDGGGHGDGRRHDAHGHGGRPAAATLVKVRVNSDPDGASVKEDGVELCSSTPCDILYKGADADPTKDHKLTLTRNGYSVETKTVKVGDSPVAVKLTVAPTSGTCAPRRSRRTTRRPPAGTRATSPTESPWQKRRRRRSG